MNTGFLQVAPEMLAEAATLLPSTVRIIGAEAAGEQRCVVRLVICGEGVRDGADHTLEVRDFNNLRTIRVIPT
jgi:hypothetical protein